jgi:hypothetical protein
MIYKDLYGQKEEIEIKQFLSYDDIPKETRQKVFFVISEYGYHFGKTTTTLYKTVNDLPKLKYEICKHKGVSDLRTNSCIVPFFSMSTYVDPEINVWIINCPIVDFLRTIEIFVYLKSLDNSRGSDQRLFNTIKDINDLFKLDKIGYEIVNERIIRKDSEFLQEQVIKQTISLLYTNDFNGPLEEFQKALDHYLVKEYKDTIQEANNSFESTMKSVLIKLRINFNQKDTASKLVDTLCDKNIIYPYTKSLFLGLPTIRNNQSGHGQGIDPREVSQNYAELALNLAGTFIVFLITRYQELNN